MEAEVLKLAGQLGGAGFVMFSVVKYGVKFAVSAIERMYTDMKEQQKTQQEVSAEDRKILMTLVEENIKANMETAMALKTVCDCMIRKDG
jgi:hypothetical protein